MEEILEIRKVFNCDKCPKSCPLGAWNAYGWCGAECTICGGEIIAIKIDKTAVTYQCQKCQDTFKIGLEISGVNLK